MDAVDLVGMPESANDAKSRIWGETAEITTSMQTQYRDAIRMTAKRRSVPSPARVLEIVGMVTGFRLGVDGIQHVGERSGLRVRSRCTCCAARLACGRVMSQLSCIGTLPRSTVSPVSLLPDPGQELAAQG